MFNNAYLEEGVASQSLKTSNMQSIALNEPTYAVKPRQPRDGLIAGRGKSSHPGRKWIASRTRPSTTDSRTARTPADLRPGAAAAAFLLFLLHDPNLSLPLSVPRNKNIPHHVHAIHRPVGRRRRLVAPVDVDADAFAPRQPHRRTQDDDDEDDDDYAQPLVGGVPARRPPVGRRAQDAGARAEAAGARHEGPQLGQEAVRALQGTFSLPVGGLWSLARMNEKED